MLRSRSRTWRSSVTAANKAPLLVVFGSAAEVDMALVHHLGLRPDSGIAADLLVAPADSQRFGLAEQLPHSSLAAHSAAVASQSNPWMSIDIANQWEQRWGSHLVNLGGAGHINSKSGHGPLPLARRWTMAMAQRLTRARHRAEEAAASLSPGTCAVQGWQAGA